MEEFEGSQRWDGDTLIVFAGFVFLRYTVAFFKDSLSLREAISVPGPATRSGASGGLPNPLGSPSLL